MRVHVADSRGEDREHQDYGTNQRNLQSGAYVSPSCGRIVFRTLQAAAHKGPELRPPGSQVPPRSDLEPDAHREEEEAQDLKRVSHPCLKTLCAI